MDLSAITKFFTKQRNPEIFKVNSFWHGDSLGWMERACLKSFLDQGVHFRLYTYGAVAGIPEGIEVADANTIIPQDDIFFFDGLFGEKSKGSPAVFSNLFRYRLQKLKAGPWVDCDMYCVKPFRFDPNEYVFAWQKLNSVNTAVMSLPHDSPIVDDLLKLFDEPYSIPPWIGKKRRQKLKEIHGTREVHPSFLPWGSVGPKALTALIKKHNLTSEVRPIESFYPITYKDIDCLFDPDFDIQSGIAPETICIHLWNNKTKHMIGSVPIEGSFMHRLWIEGSA